MFALRIFPVAFLCVMLFATSAFSRTDDGVPIESVSADEATESAEPTAPEAGLGGYDLLVVDSPAFQPCPIRLPHEFDPDKVYPLVIGLHGYGASSERYASNWYAFDEPQFIYACPQAQYPAPQPDTMGYSWFLFGTGDHDLEIKSIELAADYVLEVHSRLIEKYNISEVYLLGFSQGAQLSFKVGIENPLLFEGIGCIAGKLETGWIAEGAVDAAADDLRVFMAHGTEDEAVPIEFSYIAQDILAGRGFDVSLTATEDSHTFSAETLKLFHGWMENTGHGF